MSENPASRAADIRGRRTRPTSSSEPIPAASEGAKSISAIQTYRRGRLILIENSLEHDEALDAMGPAE
jgi:hypothetical protein